MQQGDGTLNGPECVIRGADSLKSCSTDCYHSARNPLKIAASIVRTNGPLGLWRGTTATILRSVSSFLDERRTASLTRFSFSNVPGVAAYFTGLNYIRTVMATSPYFASTWSHDQNVSKRSSTLPKLSSQGNLLAGATARVTVGIMLNPFTILKARYEVRSSCPVSCSQALNVI